MLMAGHKKNPADSERQCVPSGSLTSVVEFELQPQREKKSTETSRIER